jgi:hypothetical protein
MQVRYTDSAINTMLDGDLAENKYLIELFKIHLNQLNEYTNTLDNLIYGITNRIKIEEIIKGIGR